MDLAPQLHPFAAVHCATVLILVTISSITTTRAQFQHSSQSFHHGFIQHPQPKSENVHQFPQVAAQTPLNYAPVQEHIPPQQQHPSFPNAPPNFQTQILVHPHWNQNPEGHFYSSSNYAFPSWNQHQQQHPTTSVSMSPLLEGQASPNLFHERFGILQYPNQMQIQQHPIVQFQHPHVASREASLEAETFFHRTQNSKLSHLAKLKILAARQERRRRVHVARLRAFYHQQQIDQQRLLQLQEFNHRGTYGAGLPAHQQALANPMPNFKGSGLMPMPQVYALWKSQERQRAYRKLQMQNHQQILQVQQHLQNLQVQQHQQQPQSYPASIQEILQQQSPAAPNNNHQNGLGQYPSPHQQPSLDPTYPQDYSTIPMEQNLPPLTHFHPQPIRWRQKGRGQGWHVRRRKPPPRSHYPVGTSRNHAHNGHLHQRGVAIRQSSLSLASAGAGTLFNTLWEIMETLIGSISLFLYVVYSAVSIPLG